MKKLIFLTSLLLGLIALPATAQTSPATGMLVKTADSTAVYYIGDDGKRHAFPNSRVYFSWYDDFSTVQEISSFELSLIPLGKNVLYRSGSRLIKTPSVNEVYAVGPLGELRNIATEEVAIALYGEDWSKLVDDIDISFFFDYHIVGVIDYDGENLIYPRGSLIHNNGLTWVVDSTADGVQTVRPISGEAWQLNDFDDLITYKYSGSVTDQFPESLPMYGKEATFSCVYCVEDSEQRLSVKDPLNFVSLSGEYEITVAPGWSGQFLVNEIEEGAKLAGGIGPSQTILLAEKEVNAAAGLPADSFIVWEWDEAEFSGGLSDLHAELEAIHEFSLDTIVFSGPHLGDPTVFDIVTERVAVDAETLKETTFLEWDRLQKINGRYFQIHFSTERENFEKSIDVIDLVNENFNVHELVEEMIEEEPEAEE